MLRRPFAIGGKRRRANGLEEFPVSPDQTVVRVQVVDHPLEHFPHGGGPGFATAVRAHVDRRLEQSPHVADQRLLFDEVPLERPGHHSRQRGTRSSVVGHRARTPKATNNVVGGQPLSL